MGLKRLVRSLWVIGIIAVGGIFCGAAAAQTPSFCFLSASSYYEQVYCELQARGQTRGLPPFHQFKRNDEVIQAAILKRPAERNGIKLPSPQKPSVQSVEAVAPDLDLDKSPPPVLTAVSQSDKTIPAPVAAGSACQLHQQHITCGTKRFQLMGNRANHHLAAEALTAANRMALPRYQGADESTQIQPYLREAYRVYLSKMHEIGLAGATLNYDKFTFLFDDLRSKGLDFTERFETMYTYLKQDKKRMGVSEKLQVDESLQISDCADLSDDFMVCSRAGRNYLFVAGS